MRSTIQKTRPIPKNTAPNKIRKPFTLSNSEGINIINRLVIDSNIKSSSSKNAVKPAMSILDVILTSANERIFQAVSSEFHFFCQNLLSTTQQLCYSEVPGFLDLDINIRCAQLAGRIKKLLDEQEFIKASVYIFFFNVLVINNEADNNGCNIDMQAQSNFMLFMSERLDYMQLIPRSKTVIDKEKLVDFDIDNANLTRLVYNILRSGCTRDELNYIIQQKSYIEHIQFLTFIQSFAGILLFVLRWQCLGESHEATLKCLKENISMFSTEEQSLRLFIQHYYEYHNSYTT